LAPSGPMEAAHETGCSESHLISSPRFDLPPACETDSRKRGHSPGRARYAAVLWCPGKSSFSPPSPGPGGPGPRRVQVKWRRRRLLAVPGPDRRGAMLTGRAGAGARTHPPSPSQRSRHWYREYEDGSNKIQLAAPSGLTRDLLAPLAVFPRGGEGQGPSEARAHARREREALRQAGSASTTPLLVGWSGSLSP